MAAGREEWEKERETMTNVASKVPSGHSAVDPSEL
jgi:hypothetical protein